MGRVYLEHAGGMITYHCEKCHTYLTSESRLQSTAFQGSTGPAFLFTDVKNVDLSKTDTRTMITGEHIVRDVFCKNCSLKIGWMYEFAYAESQKYKEGEDNVVLFDASVLQMLFAITVAIFSDVFRFRLF
uniref:Protein yippee-like n=1 Tax=Bursaphelenchus xylophilus TaxID=6326 RepID=A0A1I7SKB4_BURXY